MRSPAQLKTHIRVVVLIALSCAVVCGVRAARLPVKQYTIADGLAQGTVRAIHQDSRGFIWLATGDGLSRFDGYRFTNYDARDGLGHSYINDVVQDRLGRLWVATNGGGVSMLLEDPRALRQGMKFISYLVSPQNPMDLSNRVNQILFDADNRLWCSTDKGLYRADFPDAVSVRFEKIAEMDMPNTNPRFIMDRRGRIWASLDDRLIRVTGNGVITSRLWEESGYTNGDIDQRMIEGIAELPDGRIFVASRKDLYQFIEPGSVNDRGFWRRLPLKLLPKQSIGDIHPAAGDGLWIGTEHGLIRYHDGRQVSYRFGNSPNPIEIIVFLTDRDGNMWIGTRQTGLLKLSGEAIAVFDAGDGLLPVREVYYLAHTQDDRIILAGRPNSRIACNETFFIDDVDGGGSLSYLRWSSGLCAHHLVQDGRKNWWVLRWLPNKKINRAYFIPGPQFNPTAGYDLSPADGWVDGAYSSMYVDSEGAVWFRKSGNIYRVEYSPSGRPYIREILRTRSTFNMGRDRSGTVWFTDGGRVFRYRGGKIEAVTVHRGGDNQLINSLVFDRNGRLWICTLGYGVFMTEKPDAEWPVFINYKLGDGHMNNYVEAGCEGDDGQMWFGTGRGLKTMEISTGKVLQVSLNDNSLGSMVHDVLRDRHGNIWISVIGAVIRVNPHLLTRPADQLPVYISHITIAGEPLVVSELGVAGLAIPDIIASRNNLAIEFLSPNFRGENSLRYQYRLEGVDGDWSLPGEVREVNYANLAPGNYNFLVRAIDDVGWMSREPASLRFRILRPVWQRWWFITALISLIGAAAYGAYRYRLGQAVKVERVRTRLAHDLHDDIGANLTRISILSEVAKRRGGNGAHPPEDLLDSIADISRQSVASMNDIVWAINPQNDTIADLTSRMRRHAEEILLPLNIRLDFQAHVEIDRLKLSIEIRRDLYLFFKETVNNAVRHAGCSEIRIRLDSFSDRIQLSVRDNGRGFDPDRHNNGNGLCSLQDRARAMGGDMHIESDSGSGTGVKLTIPV